MSEGMGMTGTLLRSLRTGKGAGTHGCPTSPAQRCLPKRALSWPKTRAVADLSTDRVCGACAGDPTVPGAGGVSPPHPRRRPPLPRAGGGDENQTLWEQEAVVTAKVQ